MLMNFHGSTCDTANRLTRQSNCSFNLNVKQSNSNIRKKLFFCESDKPMEQFCQTMLKSLKPSTFSTSYNDHVKNVEHI